tara:strand:- start:280 stop:1248 length:969 start_codon:yes stop_codon:yes gene_type:complete
MNLPIAIVAGEPNSISSEIIFKAWKLRKKFIHKPFIIIGSVDLLKAQKKKLKYNIKIKNIGPDFNLKNFNKDELLVYNVQFKQKKPFQNITIRSKKYILKCFDVATNLVKNKKILGIINCPVSKEILFKKHQGVTEFLSKKAGTKGNEVMLIFNKKLAVSPLTTHIPIKEVNNKIKKSLIVKKTKIINNFYINYFNKKPNIGILGLNPHNFTKNKKDKKKAIVSAINTLKKLKINVTGPISPDTSFLFYKKYKFNVILGMYHDQVLTPFKALFKYNAINITLGLPYNRVSPDHGVAKDIIGKKIANPESLIRSVEFFNFINS